MRQSNGTLRVFFDTNMLFSALYTPAGRPASLVRSALAGEMQTVISQEVIAELTRNIASKARYLLGALPEFLQHSSIQVAGDPPPEEISRWREAGLGADAPIVAAAALAEVEFFCTGDTAILGKAPLLAAAGVKIVSPAQLAEILRTT